MKKKYLSLTIISLFAIVMFEGCQESSVEDVLSSEELQEKFIEANSNIKTYTFDMNMDMNMKMDVMGKLTDVSSKMVSDGRINQEDKKMALKAIISSVAEGINMDVDMEIYMADDMMYTKTMGAWYKSEFDQNVWNQQDQLKRFVELIKSGNIEPLGDEGQFRVIKVEPDMKKFSELMLEQQSQAASLAQMDMSDMIKKYSVTVWINKRTYRMEKSKVEMKMVITPEAMGLSQTDGDMEMDTVTEMTISNINEPVEIDIPGEALDAESMDNLYGYDSVPEDEGGSFI